MSIFGLGIKKYLYPKNTIVEITVRNSITEVFITFNSEREKGAL